MGAAPLGRTGVLPDLHVTDSVRRVRGRGPIPSDHSAVPGTVRRPSRSFVPPNVHPDLEDASFEPFAVKGFREHVGRLVPLVGEERAPAASGPGSLADKDQGRRTRLVGRSAPFSVGSGIE